MKKTKPEQLIELLQKNPGGLLIEEIADHMNLSIGSVASAISRARKVCPKNLSIWCGHFFNAGKDKKLIYIIT